MAEPKVLVCCPTSDRKAYCQDEWMLRVKNLFYPNYSIFMADNSETKDNYARLIKEYGINANYIDPKGRKNYEFIAESHEACRQYAIRNKFDYMLHLESDVFPPLNVIERLMIHRLPVVSAMYHIGLGQNSFLMIQDIEKDGERRETWNIDKGDLIAVDGNVKEFYHLGLGCMLISRKVFEAIPFRNEYLNDIHSDSLFAVDLSQKGIRNYVDTSIICEHKNIAWTTEY